MKRKLITWAFRCTVAGLLIAGLLLVIVLNPILTYANRTTHNNITIYHNQTLDKSILEQLDQAVALLKTSECYNPELELDICLNDGSIYPQLIQTLRGPAFAWGFYDKVVLRGSAHYKENFVTLNGYNWNLKQLLAHEMVHCLQFDKLGLRKSKPWANIPNWKWEGYAEYVSRQNNEQKDLSKNISRLIQTDKNNWAIQFEDGTITPREYYDNWTLVQFCIDIRKMNYPQILADTTEEQTVRQEMMKWYNREYKGESTTTFMY